MLYHKSHKVKLQEGERKSRLSKNNVLTALFFYFIIMAFWNNGFRDLFNGHLPYVMRHRRGGY